MLKSSNLESIINSAAAEGLDSSSAGLQQSPLALNHNGSETNEAFTPQVSDTCAASATSNFAKNTNNECNNANCVQTTKQPSDQSPDSLATKQLTAGLLHIFQPPLSKARVQLKELIGKQNKIYIDLSAEKYKLDNAETAKLHEMMNNVKTYREKLIKIKKQMQNIYQRTKVLKKRALNVQACKQKELQRKLQKQQQEEALIGKQQQQQQQQQHQTQSPPEAQ